VGLAARADDDLRTLLGQPVDADDRTLARAVVAKVAAHERVRLARGGTRPRERASHPTEPADRTFLGRLKAQASGDSEGLSSMEDIPTLLLVLRAGSLVQRRAAALRLTEQLRAGRIAADDMRRIEATLDGLRDVELGHELLQCRAQLPSGRTRDAQRQQRLHLELLARVEREVAAYWEGEQHAEPLMMLTGDDRANLLLSARALSDRVISHVAALIEGATGAPDIDVQRALVSAVRYAGDARLLPSMLAVLQGASGDLVVEVARALSRIDDPRVQPALVAAYERSVVDLERLALGAALGRVGDTRALDYVRVQLSSHDDHVLTRALESLRALGSPDDIPQVLVYLRGEDTVLASKAAHTLGRIGDGRCLAELMHAARESVVSSVRAAAEEALDQVRARMELRGEEAAREELVVAPLLPAPGEPEKKAALVVRARALRWYTIGRFYQLLGARERALACFERATQCWQGWAIPALVAALIHIGRSEYAQALPLFRRALEAERARIERSPMWIRQVASCFLRRSEQVERDGRQAIARGLLDEVLSLDLRRVPSSLRFEIGRRHEALRAPRHG
jgi:HEAT repeat protein